MTDPATLPTPALYRVNAALAVTWQQIIDRYPWVSEEDAKRIIDLTTMRVQQQIYDEASRLKDTSDDR